ncbi:hypothetical protein PO124_04430 [Bacillus licheniformis]|nr:hypothetical protein [Bacillus licheniformis]
MRTCYPVVAHSLDGLNAIGFAEERGRRCSKMKTAETIEITDWYFKKKAAAGIVFAGALAE